MLDNTWKKSLSPEINTMQWCNQNYIQKSKINKKDINQTSKERINPKEKQEMISIISYWNYSYKDQTLHKMRI